jgi:hypothetical protein
MGNFSFVKKIAGPENSVTKWWEKVTHILEQEAKTVA